LLQLDVARAGDAALAPLVRLADVHELDRPSLVELGHPLRAELEVLEVQAAIHDAGDATSARCA
jgi:hypothetical protein